MYLRIILCLGFINILSSLQGQTKLGRHTISVSWFTFVAPKQEIFPYYDSNRKDVSVSSSPRMSFAGRLEYNTKISEHFEFSMGIVVGSYPFDVNYSYDSSFIVSQTSYEDFFYDKYSSIYGGANVFIGYIQDLDAKQSLVLKIGCNYNFFIPQFYSYTHSTITSTQTFQTLYFNANVNPKQKAFFAPEVSVKYRYNVLNWLEPFISINGVYSKNYPIVGNKYEIYGRSEKLQGTFKRRFLQAGVEIGVRVGPFAKKK